MDDRTLPRKGTALLLGLTAATLLLRLGDVPLIGPDEPRYARVAVEMHRSGDWVTPTLGGEPWLEKPILYYWTASAAFAAFGETEQAARLPSLAAAVLLVWMTALAGARLYGRFAGLTAGFASGTCVLTFVYGRAAAMDELLAAAVTVAVGLLGLRVLDRAGPGAVVAAYAAIGFAILAKGPLGVVVPVLVMGAWLATDRTPGALGRLVSPSAVGALLLVAAPWYAAILLDQGWHFVDVFLLDHNLLRFASTVHSHPGPPYYYVGVLLLGLLPWTALLLPGFGSLHPRREPADRFVLIWFLAPFAFFSVAGSKLPGYIIPCLPPLGLIMGRGALALARGERLPRGLGARATAVTGLVLSGALLGLALELAFVPDPSGPHLFPANVYGTDHVRSVLPAAVWSGLVALLVALRLGRRPLAALTVLRTGAAGFLLLLTLALPPILGHFQSGRRFFLSADGRPVVSWGGWRTAWMAGYFYNEARVSRVDYFWELEQRLAQGVELVLCGPKECAQLEAHPGLETARLAEGAKRNALLRVKLRPPLPPPPEAASSS
jgi:4-amino-4-deoxy-L-arabinose transferase-like glycosyltransferase